MFGSRIALLSLSEQTLSVGEFESPYMSLFRPSILSLAGHAFACEKECSRNQMCDMNYYPSHKPFLAVVDSFRAMHRLLR